MDELIQKCRRGDRDAQRELYAQTSDRTYRLLLRMTGNAEDAFDLAQETYLRVFNRIGEFECASSVKTWIYRIAVNEALQHLRRKKREARRNEQIGRAMQPGGDTEDSVTKGMDVSQALAALPDYERMLVVLRHFQDLSYEEMSRVLETPTGTIASGLSRARRMLRERLGEEFAKTR